METCSFVALPSLKRNRCFLSTLYSFFCTNLISDSAIRMQLRHFVEEGGHKTSYHFLFPHILTFMLLNLLFGVSLLLGDALVEISLLGRWEFRHTGVIIPY